MAEPFLSEIKIMGSNYPPKGWALCNGQTLPINQNQALFSLLGTTFGGDGRNTFALPDLRARTPIHAGTGHTVGERAGEQAHTLTAAEQPMHTHVLNATNSNGATPNPSGAYLGAVNNAYGPVASVTTMNPGSVGNTGGSQPHENRQPYLTLTFCIALQGIFPPRS